jgi:hypothetical protein
VTTITDIREITIADNIALFIAVSVVSPVVEYK